MPAQPWLAMVEDRIAKEDKGFCGFGQFEPLMCDSGFGAPERRIARVGQIFAWLLSRRLAGLLCSDTGMAVA